ncbi:MAG TPA: hypothetical protein VK206_01670 [Anaerolineales bacterium]|nr:hypothetical protein [Anaerolineales bacterium]
MGKLVHRSLPSGFGFQQTQLSSFEGFFLSKLLSEDQIIATAITLLILYNVSNRTKSSLGQLLPGGQIFSFKKLPKSRPPHFRVRHFGSLVVPNLKGNKKHQTRQRSALPVALAPPRVFFPSRAGGRYDLRNGALLAASFADDT